jgi:FtsZ-interacting cell division protein YlmF
MGLFDGFKKKDNEADDIIDIGEVETGIWDNEPDIVPEVEEEEPEEETTFGGINESAVSLKIITPKSLGEAERIADFLIGGSSVVLNIEEIEPSDVIRFMDYLQGVLHVIHGNIKQVSKTTFVATPNNVGIDSENGAE